MTLRKTALIAAFAVSLAAPLAAFADTLNVHATLTTKDEVPPKSGDGQGELTGTYDTASKMLMWHVVYSGLSGPATMAHFHGPAPVGKNAKPVIVIPADKLPSPIDGMQTLTSAQEQDMLSGNWYFNVHTAQNPGGEIRGQVSTSK